MLGKTALVVAGSSDIGRAIVPQLAASGYNIAAHYWQNEEAVQKINDQFANSTDQITWIKEDLKETDGARRLVEKAVQRYGRIDALINTIGPFQSNDILNVTPEEWSDFMHFNLGIVQAMIYYARPHLCETKGHIINFSYAGSDSLRSQPMSTAYCAAKAGVVILTKTLAAKLAPFGVRVNGISPGLIEAGEITEEDRAKMAAQIPAGRPGTPKEVAEVLHWFLEGSPEHVTGTFLPVSGAWEY